MKKIAPDKWRHFFVGIAMGAVLQAFLLFLLPAHPFLATLVAFVLVLFISYGFELASKLTRRGIYDVMDAVASVIGGVIGMAVFILFKVQLFYN